MAEINNQKFYQFLADYNKINGDWKEAADENGDGVIYKSEFNEFMNANWNGNENGELTNDIINKFWKSIDTNRGKGTFNVDGIKHNNLNALDKNEVDNLEKRLEVYAEFDEYVDENVVIPDILSSTGAQWKADVVEQLSAEVEKYIKAGCKGVLNDILTEALPAILNKSTAQYCAVEYQETLKKDVLKDYPDYKVADDKTLQKLIDAYINGINTKDPESGAITDLDADTIQDTIKDIIDAYLATAGLGSGKAEDLSNLGLTLPKGLNDLQVEVIKQSIKNGIKMEDTFKGYEEEFNAAVQKFIDAKIKEGGTFEELKAAASEFKNSDFYKQFETFVTINKTYRDVKVPKDGETATDFYKALEEAFGEEIAKMIANRDKYVKEYGAIIDDVLAKVQAGEMEIKDVDAYIIDQIKLNLEKFVGNLSNMSIENINLTYDELAEAAEAQEDGDVAWAQHREAAIKWCNAIAGKGETLKAEIGKILEANGYNSDYKKAFAEMYPDEIVTVMALLKEAALKLGDPKTFTVASWAAKNASGADWTEPTRLTKATGTASVTATVNNGTTPISQDRIGYTITATNGTASIDNLGNINYTTGNANGVMKMEVYVTVDGIKIGEPKVITVKIDNTNSAAIVNAVKDWGGAQCSDELKTVRFNADQKITASNFLDAYNGDAIIRLDDIERKDSKSNWNARKGVVSERLLELGSHIAAALSTSGLDYDTLVKASKTVAQKYLNAYAGFEEDSGNIWDNVRDQFNADRAGCGHKVFSVMDNDGLNHYFYAVSFKDFVDDIIAEYNRLVGG